MAREIDKFIAEYHSLLQESEKLQGILKAHEPHIERLGVVESRIIELHDIITGKTPMPAEPVKAS